MSMKATDIWYDADTLLEEVLDTMPADIKALFEDEGNPTENDIPEYWKPEGEELPEEFDMTVEEELQDFYDNACCKDSHAARNSFCGCGGSCDPSHLSEAAQRALRGRE
jgi:hypothetical protein